MLCKDLENELNLKYKTIGVRLANACDDDCKQDFKHCVLEALNLVTHGEKIVIHIDNLKCNGAKTGCGFVDGVPNIVGGFGNFISNGAGEGFPSGERLKASPRIAEAMITSQHQNVLDGNEYLILKPYEEDDEADIVIFFVNADQLSALTFLFNYEKGGFDTIIAPAVSGCASVFRIPVGESKFLAPRAVIGNLDIFSRPHFDADVVSFAVSHSDYLNMLKNADECFFRTNAWAKIKSRL